MARIARIVLYGEDPAGSWHDMAGRISAAFGVDVLCREPLKLEGIASCAVSNTLVPLKGQKTSQGRAVLYDGHALLDYAAKAIPAEDRQQGCVHIVLTQHLAGTYDYDGMRYHARALVGANPFLVSAAGIIEAPARERAYYMPRRPGSPEPNDDHIGYGDARMEGAIEVCAMQAASYWATGEPFCPDPRCKLHNAHTQAGLIGQISAGLCKRHQEEALGRGT